MRSEKSWVDRHAPNIKGKGKSPPFKVSFLDFTRYYRWYTHTSRSEIIKRIERRSAQQSGSWDPFKQGHYPGWPRRVV